jgi:hypothetical protein
MVLTRGGKDTSIGVDDMEHSSSGNEHASREEVRDEWRTRLEARLEQLTSMVERLAAAQMNDGAHGQPVVQPVDVESEGPLGAREDDIQRHPRREATRAIPEIPKVTEEVRRRPGKETMRDQPGSSSLSEGDIWSNGMAPIKLDAKIDLPAYDGSIDGEKLDNWIDQLESYFAIYAYDDARRLAIARLKLTSHALVWWNSYLRTHGSVGLLWEEFTELLREQFYPVGYEEERWHKWLYIKVMFGSLGMVYVTLVNMLLG